MRLSPLIRPVFLGLSLLLLASGCRSFEPTRARREQTDNFTSNLTQLAEAKLDHPLSLDDCVRIAMTNNYAVRKADLDRELYRIGKNVAFTAFLPKVAASAGYTSYSKQPAYTDQKFDQADLKISMPIFMPSTWFLYAATRHGYAAAGIAATYVRQGIVVQTSVQYYNVIIQQEIVKALDSQLEAARKTADRVEGLAGEGFFMPWEGDQARFQAESREAELDQARRQLAVVRGELLQGLGLAPNAPLELSGDTGTPDIPEGTTEDRVLKALEVNPQLTIADRQVVMQDHAVRQAFCDFIPVVSIFSTGSLTGDSMAAHSLNWASGLSGAWTLFDGLANVARYKAAKVERTQTQLERESTFLSVIIQVMATEAAVHDATAEAHIRQRAYEVAKAKHEDYAARAAEGLKPLSDALDAQAVMNLAQVQMVQSRYQKQIAIANLKLAMGITLIPDETTEVKDEK